jgi:hypothetical protein
MKDEDETHSVYEIFRDLAQLGMRATLYLRIDHELREKRGTIRRLTPNGVLIQDLNESTFVSADSLANFTLEEIAATGTSGIAVAKDTNVQEPAAEPPAESGGFIADDAERVNDEPDDRQFEIFFTPLQLSLLAPDFAISELSSDDHAELIRWKNRYEYAVKVREMERAIDDVGPIGRLAERLRHSELYFLAGSIAVMAKAYELAEPQLLNAVALGSARASAAMTWLATEKGDLAKAYEMGCRAVTIDCSAFGTQEESLLVLGRLLARLSDKDALGLSDALAASVGTESEALGNTLIAFALKHVDVGAANAALAGQIAQAKRLAPAARTFQSLPAISSAFSQKQRAVVSPEITFQRIEEFGRITAAYPDKTCGFLTNEVTAETFFFSFSFIVDPELREAVNSGLTGHKVYFTVRSIVKTLKAKYDQAHSIRLRPNQDGLPLRGQGASRQRDSARPAAPRVPMPRVEGPYSEAKKAEHAGKLEQAEKLLRETIEQRGSYRQSAIKDLAMLLGRKNKPIEGIELLNRHRKEFDVTRSVDNLKATLLIKANRYDEAANLYVELYNSAATGARERVGAAKQAGVCFTLNLDFASALKYLEIAKELAPDDATNNDLIAKVRAAQTVGALSVDDRRHLQALAGLAVTSVLSSFANFFIQMSDYKGADERSIARGFFDASDFQKIDRQLRAVRGRQSRMKGQLYQTLAAMSAKAPLEAGDVSIQEALRSCFFFMGEAAINDNLAADSVRCFLSEAAHLATRVDQAGDIARYLMNTYLSAPLSTEELTRAGEFGSVHIPVQEFMRYFEEDQKGWELLLEDFPYYAAVAGHAARIIETEGRRNPNLRPQFPNHTKVDLLRGREDERIQAELTVLRPLSTRPFSGDGLRQISEILNDCSTKTRFKLDRAVLFQLSKLIGEGAKYWVEQDYIEREASYGQVTGGLKDVSNTIKKEPTRLTIETALPIVDRLLGIIVDDFDNFRARATAALKVSNLLKDDYYVPDRDNVITLSLEFTSDRGSTPIEGISLTVTSDDESLQQVEACHSPELLRGGGRREIQVKIKPSPAQLAEQAFTLQVAAKYHNRAANKIEQESFSLPIAIGAPDAFEEIGNPYAAYSGGRIVSDPKMLFGRHDLLERINLQVTSGPVGQCFVLYGQKRSGKSSVLYRLRELLAKPQLGVLLTRNNGRLSS